MVPPPPVKKGGKKGGGGFKHSAPPAPAASKSYCVEENGNVFVEKRVHETAKAGPAAAPKHVNTDNGYPDIEMGGPDEDGYDDGDLDFDIAVLSQNPVNWPQAAPSEISEIAPGLVVKVKARKKKNTTSAKLLKWVPQAPTYLDRTMMHEGRGVYADTPCTECGGPSSQALYRCRICVGGEHWCSKCIVTEHKRNPLHVIEKWNDTTRKFDKSSLSSLGLIVQLGRNHRPGTKCNLKLGAHKNFTVIDRDVVSPVNLYYCGCDDTPEDIQILDYRWWPASTVKPRTAGTFKMLRNFHNTNMISNITTYDYWKMLQVLTDNTGLRTIPHLLEPLTLMLREWWFVKACRRCGRVHDPEGITATEDGGLIYACPICPRPGVNLPEDFWKAPPEIAWKYRWKVGTDANYKQPSGNIGDPNDKGLFDGKAVWVKSEPFNEYVLSVTDEEEISSCSEFQAMMGGAVTLKWKSFRTKAIGGVSCEHEFFAALGMIDLPKGERFSHMSYAFMSAMNATPEKRGLRQVLSTYDVNCQFWKRFWERIDGLPPHLQRLAMLEMDRERPELGLYADSEGRAPLDIEHKIPKMHLYGHRGACQSRYALHWTKYSGVMDGEHIERLWAILNPSAHSAREQGQGARCDQLNDLCNHSNYWKSQGLVMACLQKALIAIPMVLSQRRDFERFDAALRKEKPGCVDAWVKMVEEWDADRNGEQDKPSPYVVSDEGQARARLKLEIAIEEHDAVASGGFLQDITPSNFLQAGLNLQEQQRTLLADLRKEKPRTVLQLAAITDRRKAMLVALRRFRELQLFYMPGLSLFVDVEELQGDGKNIELVRLWLPSELSESRKAREYLPGLADIEMRIRCARSRACVADLAKLENRMQEAECLDALVELRYFLRVRTFILDYKLAQCEGQRQNTMMMAKKCRVDGQIFAAKNRYRAGWLALCRLRKGDADQTWLLTLQELKDEHIRALNERQWTATKLKEREFVRGVNAAAEDARADEEDEEDGILSRGVESDRPGPEGRQLFGVVVGGTDRCLSWIWRTVRLAEDGEEDVVLNEALRVEWARCWARALRWLEALIEVEEWMRQAIATALCRERQWSIWATWRVRKAQENSEAPLDPALAEGLYAYAAEQASIERGRIDSYNAKWGEVRKVSERVIREVDLAKHTGIEELTTIFYDLELEEDVHY